MPFVKIGSRSGFHCFLWQRNPVKSSSYWWIFFYSHSKSEGPELRILPLEEPGACPLNNAEQGYMAKARGSRVPVSSGTRNGCRGHTVFSARILWSFCQTGVCKAEASREFSYFLAYSLGVLLNRNQLFACSLIQHVAGEQLASGLAIIKNKNIPLCRENSTRVIKRQRSFAFRTRDVVHEVSALPPCQCFPKPPPWVSLSWNTESGLMFSFLGRRGSLVQNSSVINLKPFFFFFTTAEMKK